MSETIHLNREVQNETTQLFFNDCYQHVSYSNGGGSDEKPK